VQLPAVQTHPLGHDLPHAPQLLGSVLKSGHWPPHGELQTQAPLAQTYPAPPSVFTHDWSASGSSSTRPLQSLSLPSHVSTPLFVISQVQTAPEAPGAWPQVHETFGQSDAFAQFGEQSAIRLQSLHSPCEQQPETCAHSWLPTGGETEGDTHWLS
jgi:hypothetical protein